jgi:hypothetical protein
LDDQVWTKVWGVINDDALFARRVQAKVDSLLEQGHNAEAELGRMQKTLDDIAIERQRIITWTRKGSITESDMELQLGGLTLEELSIKRQMQEMSLLVGDKAQRLIDFANTYRAKLRKGGEFLNMTPTTQEQADKQFKLRREIVDAIVRRVEVQPDKTAVVYFEFDLDEVGSQDAVEVQNINLQSIG